MWKKEREKGDKVFQEISQAQRWVIICKHFISMVSCLIGTRFEISCIIFCHIWLILFCTYDDGVRSVFFLHLVSLTWTKCETLYETTLRQSSLPQVSWAGHFSAPWQVLVWRCERWGTKHEDCWRSDTPILHSNDSFHCWCCRGWDSLSCTLLSDHELVSYFSNNRTTCRKS